MATTLNAYDAIVSIIQRIYRSVDKLSLGYPEQMCFTAYFNEWHFNKKKIVIIQSPSLQIWITAHNDEYLEIHVLKKGKKHMPLL